MFLADISYFILMVKKEKSTLLWCINKFFLKTQQYLILKLVQAKYTILYKEKEKMLT